MNPYLRVPSFVAIAGFILGGAFAYWLTLPVVFKPSDRPTQEAKRRWKIHVPASSKFLSCAPDEKWWTIRAAGGVVQIFVNGRHCFDCEAKCNYCKGNWDDEIKLGWQFDVFADEADFLEIYFVDCTKHKEARWRIFASKVLPCNFGRWKSDLNIAVTDAR